MTPDCYTPRRPLDAIGAGWEPDSPIRRALEALAYEANRLADLAEAQQLRIAELESSQNFLAGKAGALEARVNAAIATRKAAHV